VLLWFVEQGDPRCGGEGLVSAAETSNKVILECINGTFSSITAVIAKRDLLIVHVFPSHAVPEDEEHLICLAVAAWPAAMSQVLMVLYACRMHKPMCLGMGLARMSLLS
jgi:hypothetical protein